MAKGDWWFKFEYSKWDDSNLRKCSLEAQGFWLRVYAQMRKTDSYKITGTVEDFVRMVGCTAKEVIRSIAEIERTQTAYVTPCNACNVLKQKSNGHVTLISRERKKALTIKEKSRLRVRKHRSNANVTPMNADKEEVRVKEEEKFKPDNVESKAAKPPAAKSSNPVIRPDVLPPSVDSPEKAIFVGTVLTGLEKNLNLKKLPNRIAWIDAAEFAYQNDFTTDEFLECHTLLRKQKWRGGAVTHKTVSENLPELEKLRQDVENQNGNPNRRKTERLPTLEEKTREIEESLRNHKRRPPPTGS